MKTKQCLLLLALSVGLVACKETETMTVAGNAIQPGTLEKQLFDTEKVEGAFPFYSDLVLEDVVFLEATNESRIDYPKRVFAIGSRYLVWDGDNDAVLAFDKSGKFLHRIGEKGHDEGEYVEITDVWLDRRKKMVYLLDNHSRQILGYGLDGTLRKTLATRHYAVSFCMDGDYVWLASAGMNPDKALLLKTEAETGNIVESYFQMRVNDNDFFIIMDSQMFSMADNGQTLFCSRYLNTIYKIDNGDISPLLTADFGSDSVDDSDLTSDSYMSTMMRRSRNYTGSPGDAFRIGDALYFKFNYWNNKADGHGTPYHGLFNLNTKERHVYGTRYSYDTLDPVLYPETSILGIRDHSLMFMKNVSMASDPILAKLPKHPYNTGDKTQMNPVLMIFKAK